MGDLKLSGPSVLIHIDGPNTVEPQKHQVHEVVLRKRFRVQMRMHQPHAAKTPPRAAAFGQIGYVQGSGASHQHCFYAAVAAYQQSCLATGFK